jgi:putative holliday junction resolvase
MSSSVTDALALALDVGEKRIGVSKSNLQVRLPTPYLTLKNDQHIFDSLKKMVEDEHVAFVVVGYPLSMDGKNNEQTTYTEQFIKKLKNHINCPIVMQDERLSSSRAEDELKNRSKSYRKEDIDALAATLILEDYLADYPKVSYNE